MKVKEYIRQRELRNRRAEIGFTIRIRRALRLTVEPMYELIAQDPTTAQARLKTALKTDEIEKALRWLYVDWANQQVTWFMRNYEFERKDDFWLRRLNELFAEIGAKKVTEILATTLDLAVPAIQEALKRANEGQSIDKIQRAIKQQVEDTGGILSMGRARTIARTEVIGASNTATHEAVASMAERGSNMMHRWVTGGSNIRDSHYAAEDIGWIPFDQPFLVPSKFGVDSMMHPGDPSGSAENVINCKCIEVFQMLD